MKNFCKRLLIFILSFFFFVILCDIIVFRLLYKKIPSDAVKPGFTYMLVKPVVFPLPVKGHFIGGWGNGRLPDGLEYKGKSPIVIFGCSYAYGYLLEQNQTVSYKLAKLLKRPVYNRAVSAGSFQQMYLQVTSDYYYEEVPQTKNFVYIMIDDHYRRMYGDTFFVLDDRFYPQCHLSGDKFILDNYENPVCNFFKSSYLSRLLYKHIVYKWINNPKNADEITDSALKYFILTKKEIENKYNTKVNFNVVIYEKCLYQDLLEKKLVDNGFNVISFPKLIKTDLRSNKYWGTDMHYHPREAAWDLVTPVIAKNLVLD